MEKAGRHTRCLGGFGILRKASPIPPLPLDPLDHQGSSLGSAALQKDPVDNTHPNLGGDADAKNLRDAEGKGRRRGAPNRYITMGFLNNNQRHKMILQSKSGLTERYAVSASDVRIEVSQRSWERRKWKRRTRKLKGRSTKHGKSTRLDT